MRSVRGRVWRVGTWAGVGCCLLIAVLMGVTTQFAIRGHGQRLDGTLVIGYGAIMFGWRAFPDFPGTKTTEAPGLHFDRTAQSLAVVRYQWAKHAAWPTSGIEYPMRFVSVPL